MQLKILLIKDLKSLFKQRSVIFTLIMPMLIIISFGLLPLLVNSSEPFTVAYLNEDVGSGNLNIGNMVISNLADQFNNDPSLELVKVNSYEEFINSDNAIWLPANFTVVANTTRNAVYYVVMSDSNIRSQPIMNGLVKSIIEKTVSDALVPVQVPTTSAIQVYPKNNTDDDGEAKNRGKVAFPLAYMVFLILIMGTSTMRLTGFSAEKEAGMMEILLSSVINRRELVLSKLITGIVYGFVSILSYLIGMLIVYVINLSSDITPDEIVDLIVPHEILTPWSIFTLIIMFMLLSFMSMEILLAAQIIMGRDGGDRFGSTVLTILTIMFYATSISDPLAESMSQIINPFFWVFKLALNMIFMENIYGSLMYTLMIILFSLFMIGIQAKYIEREQIIYE